MNFSLDALLDSYRASAATEREKGTYYERLCAAFLAHDPVQVEQYEHVTTWAAWALANGWNAKDVGIDLVAKLRGHDGYAAIQCKFYAAQHKIAKADIDSFLSASSKAPFVRRVVMDSTEVEWSDNAEAMLIGQAIPVLRISLVDMRASPIQWGTFAAKQEVVLEPKKELRPHQRDALQAVHDGLAQHDRGKLIMACGTGKTFTALKIAEDLVGADGAVLFLVPSLALMAQTVREWTNDTKTPLRSFAVCSDVQVGRRRVAKDDVAEISTLDLAFPATTDPAALAAGVGDPAPGKMTVVFGTYQSIQTISRAQLDHGMGRFGLIICDEAHRTTGATIDGQEESNFVRVHRDDVVGGAKRLYMTATPRIYGDGAKSKANDLGVTLATMDDEAVFGPTLFYSGFGWAVQEGLLTDYKVIVLTMDEGLVARSLQKRIEDPTTGLVLDDATRILGCYKALAKMDIEADLGADTQPMRRALAFCRDIASSKLVRDEFSGVVSDYLGSIEAQARDADITRHDLECEIRHVDGTFNAKTRGELLDWLKADTEEQTCRILSNARCLSEGVDVPALDAIMFLHPRKSQIDVVQSVGRVMRRAPGKRMGYVILPVGVPADKSPEEALNDNEKYRVVWQILNALRAHDERLEATINQMSLGQDVSDKIKIIGLDSNELRAVTATVEKLPTKSAAKRSGITGLGSDSPDSDLVIEDDTQPELPGLILDDFSRAIMAKIVKKCGDREYWDRWAASLRDIAIAHITRLEAILSVLDSAARRAFDAFLAEIRDDLNSGITEKEAVEMLAQHIITRPVFDALFEGHTFTQENPVSRAIQGVLDALESSHLEKESRDLAEFYTSVRKKAQGITDPAAKQELIRQLYDNFFGVAFKGTRDKLGIVYTPIEIVDFIIHSVNDVLQDEFGQTIGSPGVHIIDPFTGTGTFITRLLQSGLIKPEELEHKFRYELHANEIVLLAYYIAAINIEAVYHGLHGGDYTPFGGILLTDTFAMGEGCDELALVLPDNSERRRRQQGLDIRVIMGNPPYAISQHISYPHLDGRIAETYVARSSATSSIALYDSYVRAIRWGADRLGDSGVLAYVTNGGWIDANTADGMRKSMVDEFASIYVFHLRGNQRTSGETSRREGGKIFGAGSRAPIVITLFVKNPAAEKQGQVFYHDIGDYLSREDKLKIVAGFRSIRGISAEKGWQKVIPDEHGDWLKQRDESASNYIIIGDKKDKSNTSLFEIYTLGVATARDSLCFNSSKTKLNYNVARAISDYSDQLDALRKAREDNPTQSSEELLKADPRAFSWPRGIRNDLVKLKPLSLDDGEVVPATYRPFYRQWLYFSRRINAMIYQVPKLFPHVEVKNRVITVKQRPADGQVALMVDRIFDLQSDGGSQCFPHTIYEAPDDEGDDDLFSVTDDKKASYRIRDGITDAGLAHFQEAYPSETITKDDIFYYTYGLLHSEDYRRRFADNLTKELPRIPCVKTAADFWAFVDAGHRLGDLHVGYEAVEPYPVTIKQGDLSLASIDDPVKFFRVEKMAFGKGKDRSVIHYNPHITIIDVPLAAYDYVVNGKSAIEWVMERQAVRQDKDSGIVNDANDYANETVGDSRYPFDLLRRVITVSLETMKIVRSLPPLDI
ncbi:DEAD/DEAH box helicase [Xanthobacter oligotrophicus]|uniref:DEAD/DEAH box helicase n=1 Tax=Xanthobacter oligotrophicus TaxID=2607286 RepID=UPI0011F1266E|nr:type ISP restriction/modification enzyme [Xanthobacter oligotrophicus]MCG5238038.1 DEAD/DEAH box helicase family protein [Xanthobacter oligotrophicus]